MAGRVEELDPTRIRMAVEVPVSEWSAGLRDVCRQVAARTDGERWPACRLPFQAIDQRLGTFVLPQELERTVLAAVHSTAFEHDVRLMGRPTAQVELFRDGEPLRFTAVVDVRPAVTVPDITGLEVTVDPVEVAADEVEAQISELRHQLAAFTQADRPAGDGDAAQIELSLTVDGAAVPFGGENGVIHYVGSHRLPDELDEDAVDLEKLPAQLDTAVTGLGSGGVAVVQVPLVTGPWSGRDADLEVRVVAVMERRLPKVDDAFAVRAAGRPTLVDLRRELRDRLLRGKRTEQLRKACDLVLREIVARTEVPVPANVVHDEVEHRSRWMLAELEKLGVSLEDHLAERGETAEQIGAAMAATAEERTRSHIVLDTVADTEGVQVTEDEYRAEIVHRAKRVSVSPQTYFDQTMQLGGHTALVGEIRRAKAMRLLMRRVAVRDTHGNEVDTREGMPDEHTH
ncbi:trigger factor [Streptomyces sp. RKAG293]|uniref:trigger factor n=1 Tax=Streptomyces sp. RKAG293 TaxID=2893403 RepID=UPI0020344E9D|nr:trigger factor [Streptomyces sp. RKAG293]MCM2416620.1 hypothetical protein [Streptomyces sp. RKAG293]